MTSPELPRFYSEERPDPDARTPAAPHPAAPHPAAVGPIEERGEDRVPVGTDATLVANRQDAAAVTIADLSRHGCRLESGGEALRPGQFIAIRLAQRELLDAIVRWVDGDCAGLEFTRALAPEVFAYHMRQISPD